MESLYFKPRITLYKTKNVISVTVSFNVSVLSYNS
jgi:hypothetical protein